jgi:hypothetical protein
VEEGDGRWIRGCRRGEQEKCVEEGGEQEGSRGRWWLTILNFGGGKVTFFCSHFSLKSKS